MAGSENVLGAQSDPFIVCSRHLLSSLRNSPMHDEQAQLQKVLMMCRLVFAIVFVHYYFREL